MITSELSDLTLDEWQAFAESQPGKSIFHHRNWIELLVDTYGFELHIPAVKQNGKILAAVPFVETTNLWGAPKLISLPFSDCMSILANCDDAVQSLRKGLKTTQYRQYKAILLRTEQAFQPNGLATWGRHVIDTSQSLDQLTVKFDRTLRANLRRAEARKLTFEFSSDRSAFEEFSRLFLWTRQRHGVPLQPKKFFRGLYDRILLSNLGFVGLVKKGDTTIAAGVFLQYGGKMTCKYLASIPSALDNRPNEFLLNQAIRMAVQTNCSTFDFGISRHEQEGLRRFKRKFGAIENNVYNDCIAGNTKRPIEHTRAMKVVSSTIRNSPPFVGKALGALFYRYSQ